MNFSRIFVTFRSLVRRKMREGLKPCVRNRSGFGFPEEAFHINNDGKQGDTKDPTTMLVLSRKMNESIVIGDRITVTVVKVDRNCVRLGIEAPPEVAIFREELVDKKSQQPDHPVGNGAGHQS